MNILTFDIEEWYIEKYYKGADKTRYQAFDSMLLRILELLDRHHTKATFFCLGALVHDFPHVVKEIAAQGHEIGCHSLNHRWINKMTQEEFYEDTYKAVSMLREATGQPVTSFRAPAFSIGSDNPWAFEVLAKCGIMNDASIFPGTRDFGGFPTFSSHGYPCQVSYGGIVINEFPITMTKLPILHKEIAYSGGGYFRLLPISFVKNRMRNSQYNMCYFHIADLLDFKSELMSRAQYERYFSEPGTLKNRIMRYAKSNIGRTRALKGLEALLEDFEFGSITQERKKLKFTDTITL